MEAPWYLNSVPAPAGMSQEQVADKLCQIAKDHGHKVVSRRRCKGTIKLKIRVA
jgi:hypothetical protein